MKIGIDARTLMDKEYSGVSEYTLNLLRCILEIDTENEYVLFLNSFKNIEKKFPVLKGNYQIVKTNYPNKIFNYLMQGFGNYPKIDKLIGVDVFFMPHFNFASLSPDCKLILTVHDLSFMLFPEYFSLKKNVWHYALGVKKLIKRADRIIAVSETTKNDIIMLTGVREDKIKVIHSGIPKNFDNKYNEEKKKKIKKKYKLKKPFILHLGTIEPRKNIIGLIKAYEILRSRYREYKDIDLVLAGGMGWKNRKILKVWNKSKYKKDIKIIGYVDKEEKKYLYKLAQVFASPSFYEGFGFPPLEAQVCNTPVVASFISSLPEILNDSAILVDPHRESHVADAIYQLSSNKDLKNLYIKKGQINAKKYSWQQAAKKHIKEFANLDSRLN